MTLFGLHSSVSVKAAPKHNAYASFADQWRQLDARKTGSALKALRFALTRYGGPSGALAQDDHPELTALHSSQEMSAHGRSRRRAFGAPTCTV